MVQHLIAGLGRKDNATGTLEVKADGPWELFAGPDREHIDFTESVAKGHKPGTFPVPVQSERYTLFALRSEGTTRILGLRRLPLSGSWNVRDVGGFQGTDGKSVVWGKLFRADDLSSLTDVDLHYLSSIPLKTIIDFRTDGERAAAPDRLPSSVEHAVHLGTIPGTISRDSVKKQFGPGEAEALMRSVYEALVTQEATLNVYRDFFRYVSDPDNTPLLFHCSAGKDRTGLAAAFLLYALGVSEADIMDDYLASNIYLAGKYQNPSVLFRVDASFLKAALDRVKATYGTMDEFLVRELNVNIERLRSLYLGDKS